MSARPPNPDDPAEHSPTEIVEDERGELVERLSAGTATLLLAWLIGVGAGSSLLAAWLVGALLFRQRLGGEALLSGFGFYTAIFGASGPCVLWLAGRAQGHPFLWFLGTAMKIGLLMIGIVIGGGLVAFLVLGAPISIGLGVLAAVLVLVTLGLAALWALVVWSADRYIARARVEG